MRVTQYLQHQVFFALLAGVIIFVISAFRPWEIAMVAAADSVLHFVLDDMIYSALWFVIATLLKGRNIFQLPWVVPGWKKDPPPKKFTSQHHNFDINGQEKPKWFFFFALSEAMTAVLVQEVPGESRRPDRNLGDICHLHFTDFFNGRNCGWEGEAQVTGLGHKPVARAVLLSDHIVHNVLCLCLWAPDTVTTRPFLENVFILYHCTANFSFCQIEFLFKHTHVTLCTESIFKLSHNEAPSVLAWNKWNQKYIKTMVYVLLVKSNELNLVHQTVLSLL